MRLPRIMENSRGRDIAFVAALGIVQAALMMAAAFATRIVFSALSEAGPFPTLAIAALLAVPICLALVQAIARISAEKIGQSFAIDLRETVFRTIAALPSAERAKRSLGGLSLRFVGDMSAARGWAGLGVTRLISGVIVLPAAALTLWLLNPALALAGIAPIAVAMILFGLIGQRLHSNHKRLRKRRADVAIWAMERIGMAHELAAMGRLDRECGQLKKRGSDAAEHAVTRIRTTSTLRMIPNASLGLGSAAVLVTALALRLPTGEAAAALAVLAILTIPLRQLVGVWDKHAAWAVARAKIETLISRAVANRDAKITHAPVGVTFPRTDVVPPLSVAAGDTHLFSPGVNWKPCLDALTGHGDANVVFETGKQPDVAVISRDPVVLKGSLRRALTMGCIKRPPDEVLLDLAARFGLKMGAAGLDQRIANYGADLEASDRLRISMLQAITRNPSIVVVTEPFWFDPDARTLWDRLQKSADATLIAAPAPAKVLPFKNVA